MPQRPTRYDAEAGRNNPSRHNRRQEGGRYSTETEQTYSADQDSESYGSGFDDRDDGGQYRGQSRGQRMQTGHSDQPVDNGNFQRGGSGLWSGSEGRRRDMREVSGMPDSGSFGQGQQGDQQRFRGVGPKGYARSDDRLKEQVCDALSDDNDLDASDIEVQVQSGEVTLDGQVDSRNAKRHAEDCVEAVSGVKHCQNNLRVRQGGQSEEQNGSMSASANGSTDAANGQASRTGKSKQG